MTRQGNLREWLSRNILHVATDARWVLTIVLCLSLASSAFSIRYLSTLESDIADLYENDVKGQTYAQNAYVDLLDSESAAKEIADRRHPGSAFRSCCKTIWLGERQDFNLWSLKATQTLNAARYKSLIANAKRDVTAFATLMREPA